MFQRHSQLIFLLNRRSTLSGCFTAGVIVSVFFLTIQCAIAQQDFSSLIEQAKANFKPVDDEQVAAARAETKKGMKDVEQFVGLKTKNGKRWLNYLKWDDLKQHVNDEKPKDVDAVAVTLDKLNRNVRGLEHRRFRRLARALRQYRDTLAVGLLPEQQTAYNQQLAALQEDLEAYRKEPSSQTEIALSERMRIVDSIGQSPELVKAVQSELAHPNAFLDVQTSLLAAGIEPVNRTEPITDCILGTNIRGTAHTTGNAGVATLPSNDKAVIEFITEAHSFSRNMGYKSPAVIRSSANTNFTAIKRVELTDAAFVGKPARANASTRTQIQSVAKQGGGLGSRLVSRIGWKKAMQSKGQAEAIAADHAEDRVERQFNREVNDQISKLRDRYEEEYRRPLERKGEVPEHIRFFSGKQSLNVEVIQANRFQLGAKEGPPAAEPNDMTMRLHETAFNNYSASLLSGATAKQSTPDEDLTFDVELPSWLNRILNNPETVKKNSEASTDSFKPVSLKLQELRPISIQFLKDEIKVTLHIAELISGDRPFENWDVVATYYPKLEDGRVVLNRPDKVEPFPADHYEDMNAEERAERSNIQTDFEKRAEVGRGFPKTIELEPLKPDDQMAQVGPLDYRQFLSNNGWLIVGLDRHSKHAEIPAPTPAASKAGATKRR